MKTLLDETPNYIIENYGNASPRVYRLEDGPYAGCNAHIAPMMYTCGIMVSDANSWRTRWCYEFRTEAVTALDLWSGQGDPPGNWIKQKPQERHGPGSTVPKEHQNVDHEPD